MKRTILSITLITLLVASCNQQVEKKISDKIPFEGTWSRSFSMGDDLAKVTYSVTSDSISYAMGGSMNMQYSIKKDTFISKENKWIGILDSTHYVIFSKNLTSSEITLLKLKTDSREDALKMAFPADTARSQFSSWNTFKKN